ncbi:unnamed protein product [Adineta steineri]|uniref:G-protein coupled receptors family 1 profile domain-containing protein n=1 Tax=Adineta steineri TaxID=433720 RepID=A0A819C193_9BILA|nr:unnamed protein product [Adineta steineri]CAF3811401.1 unnamed protein product [Adineta steineri]
MSSSSLLTIQNQIFLYGYSICVILGNIGNVLIVILLSRQRQNPCSIYLINLAILNDLYLILNSFVQIFPFSYSDESLRVFIFCKIRLYLSNIFGQLAKTILVFACIDRFMITSDRATIRALSTPKRVKRFVLLAFIFWIIFPIHIPIMITINNGQYGAFGIYAKIYSIYIIIFFGFIPSILLSIFGYMTYRNMRKRRIRIQPIVHNSIQRRDRNLLVIVISEVFIYVITATPLPLFLLEMMISQYILINTSIQSLQTQGFIINITYLLLMINSTAPFYIYFISSKVFRQDVKQLIKNIYQKIQQYILH